MDKENKMSMDDQEKKKMSPMRRESIYQIIQDQKMVKVSDLSEETGVTKMTVRRDLEFLEKKGLIERIHGGAILSNRGLLEPLFSQKSMLHRQEKDAIAKKAASLVQDYETIFINSGSTSLRLFHEITAKHVKIVTNNAYFPMEDIPDNLEVLSTGGNFSNESFTYYGDLANYAVSQVWATKAFIGVDGIDVLHGLTSPVQAEGQINRSMIEHTKNQVIIIADSSKIGRVSNFFLSSISVVNMLITDKGISEKDLNEFTKQGIEVVVV